VMTANISEHLSGTLRTLGYADAQGLVTTDAAGAPSADGELQRSSSRSYLWRDLRDKVGLDAAFFHDGVPLVGFSSIDAEDGLLGIRKKLWNYGRVPLLIASKADGFEAYNAINNPITSKGPAAALTTDSRQYAIAGTLNEVFSRRSVEAGLFATQFSQSYGLPNRVDQGLLANLRYLRRRIAGNDTAIRSGVDALVGASLTASYLADRDVLDSAHMNELCGVDSLDEVLSGGKEATLRLFAGLAERFNGDVFGHLDTSLAPLDDQAFWLVASLLRGDHLPSGQGALWPYDFRILPPDLVSSVYEQLLEDQQKQDAAYYTPRPIVDVVLDEVLSWDHTRIPTLIDLACGSGTFMTEAFRRLAFRVQSGTSQRLSYPELRTLLTDHIFGIDKNPTAARVAAFGLYLALLEEVDPPTIWQSVTLPKLLDANIVVADAFDDHPLRNRTFDIIVSNPPWKSMMSTAAESFVEKQQVPVADNQIAHAFVWLAEDMLNIDGRLGLVLPAKSILHNRSTTAKDFRAALFDSLNVRVVVDLSPMRRSLFMSAIAPTAIVVADKRQTVRQFGEDSVDAHDQDILHVAVHPRPFTGVAGALVISPEDLHVVSVKHAVSRPDIWKVLVWGSPRDLDFIDRLRSRFPSLRDVVAEHGWSIGQGFKAGGQPQSSASHLSGLPIVDTESVLSLRSPRMSGNLFDRPSLHRPRSLSQYIAPQVLVRRTLPEGRLAATVLMRDAVYSSELMSISATADDADQLTVVALTIVSSVANYWQFMTSASWGIERGTVELNELLDMPMPFPVNNINSAVELWRSGQNMDGSSLRAAIDDVVFSLFKLEGTEVRRIREGLVNGLSRFDGSPDYKIFASEELLTRYVQTLVQSLSSSFSDVAVSAGYRRDTPYVTAWTTFQDRAASPGGTESGAAEVPDVDADAILSSASTASPGATGMVSLPAAFLIDGDTIYIVKTADTDRWSYDAALSDADRIFAALAFGG
jgi:hypothetical protein